MFEFGDVQLWIDGMHNHRRQEIITVFTAVAERAPGSYGVLYVFDDEDEAVQWNNWRRFAMRRGAIVEEPDDLLSPHVGLVEDDCGYDGLNAALNSRSDLSSWVPSENLLPFLAELSRTITYAFDDGDEAAFVHGVSTSDIGADEWFETTLSIFNSYRVMTPGASP